MLSLYFKFDKTLRRFPRTMLFYSRIIFKCALSSVFANMSALGEAIRAYILPAVIFLLAMIAMTPMRILLKHPTASVSNDIPNRRKSLAQLKRLNLRQEAEEGLEEIEQMKEDIVAMTITGKGKTIAGFALMILLNLVCFYLIISIALLAPESEQVSWNNFIYRLLSLINSYCHLDVVQSFLPFSNMLNRQIQTQK
eukprot:TRINITY_DN13059_c0_g1_i3.p1 TRINITY_DN13059_c0_g1~~TRINITY_DN13059_c0_g1_i3.p1  ORF type:complete len:196 (-),score=43.48 TRINITY_DN13059_c0_g1_i3:169-756(-)